MGPTSGDDLKANKKSPFNFQQYDAQLALAFQSDCENFLHKFKQQEDYSFTAFVKSWQAARFLAIFRGQDNILNLQTFLENCFFIVKKFLYTSDIYLQTGAIYLLYSLYYKQPIKQWVKVRLTDADVEKLNEIVEIHKANRSLDPAFIYSKMRIDGAFQYCVLARPLGLEAKFMRRIDLSNEVKERKSKESVLQKFRMLLEQETDMVQFEETDDEYQKLSQKYKDEHRNLVVFPSKVGEELKRAYSEVFEVELNPKSDSDLVPKKKTVSNTKAVYRGDRKVVTAFDLQKPSTSK